VFGIRTASADVPHLVDLHKILEGWVEVMEIGATPPVDVFPILKWVPERFLGNWITRSRRVGRAMDALYGRTIARVQHRRLRAGSRGSFIDGVLDQQEKLGLSQDEVNFLGGVMMEGGTETTSSVMLTFIHAMIKFPRVQKKAQEEIDAVVGEDRSPLWSDYARLPYVSQIVKETMRWRPITPLSFPHALKNGMTGDPPG
jgi:cytochrome P450